MPRLELNAFALMLTTVSTAALGLAFWTLAARTFDAAHVGAASAELSAAMLIGALCQLNFANVFPRFLPVAGARTGLFVKRGYAATVGLSLAAGTAVALSPLHSSVIVHAPGARLVFVAAIGLLTVFVLQDAVLTGLRETRWVPVENIVFAVIKLGVLVVLAVVAPSQGIILAWVGPLVIAIVLVNAYLFRRVIPERERASEGRSDLPGRREFLAFAGAEYANGLVANLVPLVLPLLVRHRLGAEANAYFYLPWILNSALNMLVTNIALSLVVESATEGSAVHRLVRRAVRLALVVALVGAAGEFLLAPYVLGILGADYADQGAVVSRWLALSVPLNVVNVLFASLCRIDRTVGRLVITQLLTAGSLLGTAYLLLGSRGLEGVGMAYLLVQGSAALILTRFVTRRIRRMRQPRHVAPRRRTLSEVA